MRPRAPALLAQLTDWWLARQRQLVPLLLGESAPLDLRIAGRMLLQAALVGAAAGVIGALFFGGLEYFQTFFLERLAGYTPLRAHGEGFATHAGSETQVTYRPWLLILLPALGGLGCGLLTRLAPETRGGGGDATIEAFHHRGGVVRKRVIWVKMLASFLTLGTGGAGGREGPTMQIGGALGSLVGRLLQVSARERRILLIAGVAAGISAVFRTPLGAALLAVEFLYRDGFESDALIPSVLASVISYSVVISIFGESTLFAHAPRYPFVPAHLPLFGLMALSLTPLAAAFVGLLRRSRRGFRSLPLPGWAKPALGGLGLGLFATGILWLLGGALQLQGHGLGILGGGYGAVQMAVTGGPFLPGGWTGVQLLALLSVCKLLAACLTIGSGGSAGDFAPSLAIGGLFGGAFGRAVQLLLPDQHIDPGAFALVGMGAFYGGIAHVPLSALVLVCEMAGNYDLLVPLMLAQGIAFVVLRRVSLYEAQVPTQRDSPVHRDTLLLDALKAVRVGDLLSREQRAPICFEKSTPTSVLLQRASEATQQDVFPVVDAAGRMTGIITSAALRVLALEQRDATWALAADIMEPPVWVHPEDDLRLATERLLANGMRELPILDAEGRVLGILDEAEVARLHVQAATRAEEPSKPDAEPR